MISANAFELHIISEIFCNELFLYCYEETPAFVGVFCLEFFWENLVVLCKKNVSYMKVNVEFIQE